MSTKSIHFVRRLGLAAVTASAIALVGCAGQAPVAQAPGIGDATDPLASESFDRHEAMWDARLRRQGMAAVRDNDRRIQGFQVYSHGIEHGFDDLQAH